MDEFQNASWAHNAIRQLAGSEMVAVTVKGDCMAPWIKNDSRVQVSPARFFWPGDVVVVLSQHKQYLAHRVIGAYGRFGRVKVLTQADASLRPDTAVAISAILGKVSGGLCHPHVVSVPLHHRLKAMLRFVQFAISYLTRRSDK